MSRSLLEKRETKKKNREQGTVYEKSKTSVVLMEIIISIFLFMVVGSVCIQLFVRTYSINKMSTTVQNSSVITAEVAEIIVQSYGNIDSLADFYPEAEIDGGIAIIYYDEKFTRCNKDMSTYRLVIKNEGEGLKTFYLIMFDDEEYPVYDMSVKVATYVK